MKNLTLILLLGIVAFLTYQNHELTVHELTLLKQVKALNEKIDQDEAAIDEDNKELQASEQSHEAKLNDLKTKLGIEQGKLDELIEQRRQLSEILNDPARANSIKDSAQLLQDKRTELQSLEDQLNAVINSEKNVDQNSGLEKRYQSITKDQAVAELNVNITASQAQIKATQSAIDAQRRSTDINRVQNVQALNETINKQKYDLAQLINQKNLLTQSSNLQNTEIQRRASYEKGSLKVNEQNLRDQIKALKENITFLGQQKGKTQNSYGDTKQKITNLEQQIQTERSRVNELQELIKKQ